MKNIEIKDSISSYIKHLGLNCFGFMKMRKFCEVADVFKFKEAHDYKTGFEKGEVFERLDPRIVYPFGKTIISIAFPYYFYENDKSRIYFSKYCQSIDYHIIVKKYLDKICFFLKENFNCEAISEVDNNKLLERHIAYLSGLGFIGKNNMLITKEYGSFVFLGEVITSLELEENVKIEGGCGECSRCEDACPTKSLNDYDCSICLSNLTQAKCVDEKWYKFFKNRLWGCDICQDVCPFNKDIPIGVLSEFLPLNHLAYVNIDEIKNLSNSVFKEKYRISACGWRGKKYLIRNLNINLLCLK